MGVFDITNGFTGSRMHGLRDYFFIFFPPFFIVIIIIIVVVIIIFTSPFIYIASRKKANVSCIFRNQKVRDAS